MLSWTTVAGEEWEEGLMDWGRVRARSREVVPWWGSQTPNNRRAALRLLSPSAQTRHAHGDTCSPSAHGDAAGRSRAGFWRAVRCEVCER